MKGEVVHSTIRRVRTHAHRVVGLKRIVLVATSLAIALVGPALFAQSAPPVQTSFFARFGGHLPVGDATDIFGLSMSGGVGITVKPVSLPLYGGVDVGYALAPVGYDAGNLHLFHVAAEAGPVLSLTESIVLRAFGRFGVFYATIRDVGTAFNPYAAAGAGVQFVRFGTIALGAEAAYRMYLGLYQDLNASVVMTFHL